MCRVRAERNDLAEIDIDSESMLQRDCGERPDCPGRVVGLSPSLYVRAPTDSPMRRSRCLETKMLVHCAYIVGLHGRSIGVVQMDCVDDDSAIKSASRLVDSHDVEPWQMDRPIARFDARPKQMFKK